MYFCWIEAQFLAHKQVNFASFTDIFLYDLQNYWNLDLRVFDLKCKHN